MICRYIILFKYQFVFPVVCIIIIIITIITI